LLAFLSVTLAQTPSSDQALPTRRHRIRRPNPSLKEVNNPEGDEAGLPIPLRRTPGSHNNTCFCEALLTYSFDIFQAKARPGLLLTFP